MTNKAITNAAVWYRVSTGHQDSESQVPDVERFAAHRGYTIARTYTVADSAWKNGGGPEYKATLQQALDDAWQGKFSVLIVWSLDRIVRNGAEDALRVFRQFSERGCTLLSVKESWLNGSHEVQEILISFAGWMARQESQRRSERMKASIAKRKAEGRPVGRKAGSADKAKRKAGGYRAAWAPDGARRKAAEQGSDAS